MSEPIKSWATNDANVIEPSDGRRVTGWANNEQVASAHLNRLFQQAFEDLETARLERQAMLLGNWTPRTGGVGEIRALVHDGTRWVGVGNGDGTTSQIVRSPDGILWTPQGHGAGAFGLRGIASNGAGLLVAVGDRANDGGTDRGLILTSADGGVTWTRRTGPVDVDLKTVVFAGGVWVAVGDASTSSPRAATSPDGTTWTLRSLAVAASFAGLAYHSGTWVAVGTVTGGVAISTDSGVTWAAAAAPPAGLLRDVTWSEILGKFLAVGETGSVWTSTDGNVWTSSALGLGALYSCAEDDGVIVVVGAAGVVATSSDGTTWISRATGEANDLFAVARGPGYWTVAGEAAAMLTSLRGVA